MKSIILSLFLFITFGNLIAQSQELRFKHLTTIEGLSQNIVNCVFQDSREFMWFGTMFGLNKYDGYEFTIYDLEGDENQRLSDDWIKCIIEDSDGNLWIGTGNGGINIFNRKLNKITLLEDDSSYSFKSDNKNIEYILEDSKNNIWFLTSQKLIKIDRQTKEVIQYDSSHFKNKNFLSGSLSVIIEDRENILWIGSDGGGLARFDPELETFEYYSHSQSNKNSISDNSLISLYEDSDGSLWIGTYTGGLNRFDRENNYFQRFIPNKLALESYTIKAIADDNNGHLWLGTRNGLYLFNKLTGTFNQHALQPNNPNSISHNNVQAIYRDNKGNFWLGTKRGVNFFNIENMQFTHYRADVRNNRHLNHSSVNDFYQDNNNNIWFATAENGLNKLNIETGIFDYYTHNPNDINSISSNNINSIAADENGNLWIGTFQGGLNFFDRRNNCFSHYKLLPNQPLIYQSAINSLLFSSNKTLWVGTANGLMTFNRDKKIFEDFSLIGFVSSAISCIIEDGANNIWAGGNNSRLYMINVLSKEQKSFKLPTGSEFSLIGTIVAEDQLLWIGTTGGGLFAFNKTEESFKRFTKKDGLPDNGIRGLLIDEQKNVWISTFNGLSKYNSRSKKFTNYFKENGLQNNQFTTGHFKARDGQFFLGDIDGAISFYPENITEQLSIPPVTLIDFKVLNHPVTIGGDDPILTSHINEVDKVSLSYAHSSFTFTFAALDYAMSGTVQYAYMMDGFEKDWNYVGKRRYATYTNLNPGNYVFKVKAANNAGQWSPSETSVKISISPPYWDTLWFKLIIASVIILGCLHFINFQRQKRNLLKATALANLTQLKLLRNQMNPHFLLNAFSAIRALVLIDKNSAWEMISKLSEYFRYVLLNYKREKDTLDEELDAAKNYIGIQQNCFHDSMEVIYNIDEEAKELIVPAFIFQPLIENAIKYGSQSSDEVFKIKVAISYVEGILTIDISNTGELRKIEDDSHKDEVHGTSIENIKKRLSIMFKDYYSFKLYEDSGCVHAIIKIEYDKSINAKAVLHKETSLLEETK